MLPPDLDVGPSPTGSRYRSRIEWFEEDEKPYPRLRHHWWWLVHNTVAHLAIAFFPTEPTFRFHDWTSMRLNNRPVTLKLFLKYKRGWR